MKIDIESRYLGLVKDSIKSIVKNDKLKIYVFGSRSKGTSKQYSDLDIALDLGSIIDPKIMSKIIGELDETTIPYKVDVIDLNNIQDSYRNCIKNDLIQI